MGGPCWAAVFLPPAMAHVPTNMVERTPIESYTRVLLVMLSGKASRCLHWFGDVQLYGWMDRGGCWMPSSGEAYKMGADFLAEDLVVDNHFAEFGCGVRGNGVDIC